MTKVNVGGLLISLRSAQRHNSLFQTKASLGGIEFAQLAPEVLTHDTVTHLTITVKHILERHDVFATIGVLFHNHSFLFCADGLPRTLFSVLS